MGRQMKELRRALIPIAPAVADTSPVVPAPLSSPPPVALPERVQQRKRALKGKTI